MEQRPQPQTHRQSTIGKCLKYWKSTFNYRFIFVAVPKTASTTVSRLHVCPQGQKKYKEVGNRTHFNLNEYRKGLHLKEGTSVGEKIYQDAYKFGFVRNPWDRLVSLYENRKERHQCTTFDKFVDKYDGASFCQVNPLYHEFQLDWFRDPTTRLVMSDYIGKYENLKDDLSKIFEEIGLVGQIDRLGTWNGDPPAKNQRRTPRKTKSIPYQEYYTRQTQQIVLEKCSEDIQYFNYNFE